MIKSQLTACSGKTPVCLKPVGRTQNDKLYLNGVYVKDLSDKLWWKLRIEADPETQKASCKVNGKVVGEAALLAETDKYIMPSGSFDSFTITGN